MDAEVPSPARSETGDRYLEAVYYIGQEGEVARPGRLAEWLGVSAPTVTVTLQRLARDGWVRIAEDRSVELTDAGTEAAAGIVRRHRIVERWLTDVLRFDWATADREAAALAPGISAIVLDRLDAELGHPVTCPHGNVIPGRRPPKGGRLTRLVDLAPGREAMVARISEVAEHEAPHLLRVLDARGLVPGTAVRSLGGAGREWRLEVRGDEIAVEPNVARAIWVDEQAD